MFFVIIFIAYNNNFIHVEEEEEELETAPEREKDEDNDDSVCGCVFYSFDRGQGQKSNAMHSDGGRNRLHWTIYLCTVLVFRSPSSSICTLRHPNTHRCTVETHIQIYTYTPTCTHIISHPNGTTLTK